MINQFLYLYSPEFHVPFQNVTELMLNFDWTSHVSQTTQEFFDLQGVDRRWVREMIEAATRVNYGQVTFPIVSLSRLPFSSTVPVECR